tara:strand:- start:310 stop:504 length:195 start_codon:yes stop_codon:yes gene_type:complete
MGKLIGGIVKIILTIISYIPFIGTPLVNAIIFILENLFAVIKKLPYLIGGAFVIVMILSLMGVI